MIGPSSALLKALELYGKGYRPTSNRWQLVSLGTTDYKRRMGKDKVYLTAEEFAEIKQLCKRYGT